MEVTSREAKTILTAQRTGFLASGPYPFTHSLSAYTGCGFGQTTCGLYCYAQFMPNWRFHNEAGTEWGKAVQIKSNAAELLDLELKRLGPAKRPKLRIFMSSSTDPYQPIESKYEITRRLLEVFARYDDLDLLVIQTRSPLASRDFDLIKQIPYAWLSVTIETDDQALLHDLKGGPSLAKRFALLKEAKAIGLNAQITVSPCLPYTPQFAHQLQDTGVDHIIIDNFVDGDGSGGNRTSQSGYAKLRPDWNEVTGSESLFQALNQAGSGIKISWSANGFCGIPPRNRQPADTPALALL